MKVITNEPIKPSQIRPIDCLQEFVIGKFRTLMKRLKKNKSCVHKVSTIQMTFLAGNFLSM